MAVAFDARMTGGNDSDGDAEQHAASTSITSTGMTVGASGNFLVAMFVWASGAITSPSATWDGTPMTAGPNLRTTAGGSDVRAAIFYLASPATGNKTLAGSWTTAVDCYMSAVSFSGVDTATPVATGDNATSATSSVTVTSTTDGATVACSVKNSGDPTMTQTAIWANSPLNPGGGGSYALGGTSNNHSFTYGAGTDQANVGIHILAASGGTNVTPTAVALAGVIPTPSPQGPPTNVSATAVAAAFTIGKPQISTVQAIAKIADRGVRNSTGTGNATLTLTNPTLITVGNYLVARVAVDNSGSSGARPGLTLTDARNGTWTHGTGGLQDPGAASAGSASYLCYVKVAVAYQAADALTFTWTTGTPISAIVVEEWAGVDLTTPLAVAETQANNVSSTAQPSISRTPTAAGQLMYVCCSNEGQVGDWGAQDSDTTDGSWVDVTKDTANTGTHDTSQSVYGGYKIVTGTTAQTWNNTLGVTGDWSACAVVFAAQAPSLSIVANDVAAVFVIPTPTVSTPAGTNVTATAVAATFVVPTPTFTMSASPVLTAVAAAFTIPAPAITVTTTPTPTVVAATFVAPAPAITVTTRPSPTAVAATFVIPAPVVSTSVSATLTAVAGTFVIPTPVPAVVTNVAATTVTATFVVPTPTFTLTTTPTPTATAAAFVVPTPSVTTGSNTAVGATAVAATFTVPTPAVAGTQVATTAPAATFVVPTPAISGTQVATTAPAAVFVVPTPAVSTSSSTNITATAVALVGTVPTPTFNRTTTPTPTAVAMICAAPTPAVTASATILATVVAAIFQIGTSSPLAPSLGGHGFEVVTVQHGVETVTAQHGGETTVAQHGSEVTDT